MISLEDFDSLQVGDVLEANPIFPALDPGTPVKLRCDRRGDLKGKDEDLMVEFVATYFGVTLGRWKCKKEASGLKWEL
jgi:hypothetical protein